jgi:hypothetical protein
MLPHRVILAFLSVLLMITGLSARPYQGPDGVFFEETGYWVQGEFLDFYQSAPSPDRIFGRPISDVIADPIRPGIRVQYFERARMDYDPALAAGERVRLSNLGQTLRDESRPGEPQTFSTNTNMCRTFSNGRPVCYAFLQFYDRYNGPVYFGEPISGTESLDGRLVQYFERARMEWRSDRPTGERVVLTELGRIDYDIRVGGSNIPRATPLRLTAHAFVDRPVLAEGAEQQVFVVVYDQKQAPVRGVNIFVTVLYPDGHKEALRPEVTDEDGLSGASFRVKGVLPNQVVSVTVEAQQPNGAEAAAATWFRIWW